MYLQSIAICKQTLKPTSWISNAVGERVGVGHLLGHTPTLHRYPGRQAGGGPRPALAPAPVWTPSLTADSRRARRGGQGRTQRHCQIWATIETCSRYFNVGAMVRAHAAGRAWARGRSPLVPALLCRGGVLFTTKRPE